MRTFFITLSVLIILGTVGVFVYLLFFKTHTTNQTVEGGVSSQTSALPQTTTIATRTPQEINNAAGADETATTSSTATSRVTSHLKLLFKNPVAGAGFISAQTVRFIEYGSGDVYDFDLKDGVASKILTGVQGTARAEIAHNGSRILSMVVEPTIVRYAVSEVTTRAGGHTVVSKLLPPNTTDATMALGATIVYARQNPSGGEVHAYTPQGTDTVLASVPFGLVALSGSPFLADVYAYPKPASDLSGVVLRINTERAISYAAGPGRGLTAHAIDAGVLTTQQSNNGITSQLSQGKGAITLARAVRSDTCSWGIQQPVFCAGTQGTDLNRYPDDWYMGIAHFTDDLSAVYPTGIVSTLTFPTQETGVSFEVSRIIDGPYVRGAYLIINKNDGGLWLYTP